MRIVEETHLQGASVSEVARRHGVCTNQAFGWRRLMAAASPGEEAVAASDYRSLGAPVRELQRTAAPSRTTVLPDAELVAEIRTLIASCRPIATGTCTRCCAAKSIRSADRSLTSSGFTARGSSISSCCSAIAVKVRDDATTDASPSLSATPVGAQAARRSAATAVIRCARPSRSTAAIGGHQLCTRHSRDLREG